MAAVWDHSTTEGVDRLVLLALADHADHDGYAWPSVSRLAAKCRVDRRTVFRALAACEAKGEVERTSGRGRGTVNRYRLAIVDNMGKGGVNLSPLPPDDDAEMSQGCDTPGTGGRDTVVTQNRQEPSLTTNGSDAVPPEGVGAKVAELRTHVRGPS
jgi:hypothetical protein